MTNGLGAGFFALTLVAVLAGCALFGLLGTAVATVYFRQRGRVPPPVRYLLALVGVGVLGVGGFGVLVLYDEAPAAAWLFSWVVVLPFLAVGGYLARTTAGSRLEVLGATTMAWGVPFALGLVVVFGVMAGASAAFDLAPAESRGLGVAWIAAVAGGLTVVLGMLPIGARLGPMLYSRTDV
jgi:hypothetical protein